jgi:competence protein ComEC
VSGAAAAWSQRYIRHLLLAALVAGLLLRGGVPALAVAGALGLAGALLRAPTVAAGMVLALLAGGWLGDARLAAIDRAALPAAEAPIQAEATLLEAPRPRSDGSLRARATLEPGGVAVVVLRPGEEAAEEPAPVPRLGEVVRVRGTAGPLARTDAYQRLRGARATVEVDHYEVTGRRRGGVAGALDTARRRAEAALTDGVAPTAGLLARGMVLGQDEALPAEVREDFVRSGLAHLLAVSGQNVVLLCLLVFGLAAVAGLPLHVRLLVALVLVAAYVPLAGGGPSIQRAGVMGAAGLVATLAGRPTSRWYALGLAAAATLTLNPRAAAEPGWQLSFAAVIGLLAWVAPMRAALLRRHCPRPLAEASAVTTCATLATAPLLALHFEQVSVVSLPANLVAAPAVAPLMWLGMLASALGQVSSVAAAPVAWLCAPFVAFVAWVAREAGEVSWATAQVPLPGAAVVAIYVLAAIVTLLVASLRTGYAARVAPRVARVWEPRVPPTPSPRALRTLGAPALVALAAAAAVLLLDGAGPPARAPGELVVSFLDVGQGDATLLQRDRSAVLFDTGPPGGPVLQRLAEAGVSELDALVLTHAEADHEGAAPEILRRIPTRMVINGGAGWPSPVQSQLPRLAPRALAAQAGQRIRVAGVTIDVLWPKGKAPPAGSPNDHALVAHVRLGDFDLLLPADAESPVTAPLDLPQVEALKVAHHGSEDAGLAAQLERLRPRFAAIMAGRRNRYGHPHPATLAALEAVVPQVARTDRDGTVRLHVRGGDIWFESGGRRW